MLLATGLAVSSASAQTATVPLRINAGNYPSAFTDGQGRVWTPDQYGSGGGGGYRVTLDENSAVDFMLSSVRDSVYDAQIVYSIPLANGTYQVNLHFVEYSTPPGSRKFNVLQNGAMVVQNLDIAAEAGLLTRLVKPLPLATVSNGILQLVFQTQVGRATIAGIEVLSGGPAPPNLTASPAAMNFSATVGGPNPASQILNLSNSGGGSAIAWTASENGAWLTLSSTGGNTPAGVTVSVASSGLPTGTYNADITITGNSQTRIVPVTLAVGAAQDLTVAPTSLSFAGTVNGANPASKTLSVTNAGAGAPIGWSVSDDATWLTVSPGSGSTPATLNITATAAGLAAGLYNASVTVTGAGQTRVIPVTFDVTAVSTGAPFIRINCGQWPEDYTDQQGRTWVTDRYFTGGGASYNSAAENGLFEPMLSSARAIAYRPYEFTYQIPAPNGSYQVNLHMIEPGAPLGSRIFDVFLNGALVLDDFEIRTEVPLSTRLIKPLPVANVTNGILEIRVVRVVGNGAVAGIEVLTAGPATPVLAVSPGSLTFLATQGGSNPPSQSFSITNTGAGGAIGWTASTDAAWLTVSPNSGNTPSTSVSANATIGALGVGTHTATITVMAAGQTKTIPVSFTISPPPNLTAGPATLTFNATIGSNPASQSISITDTSGGPPIAWTAGDDASWLTVVPGNGSTPAPAVGVNVSTAGLGAGTYTATITVTGAGQTRTIGVTLNVISAPNLQLSPSALSFTATAGGANPAAKTFDVANIGSGGSIAWTATDDASWLSVSPGNGSTPSTGVSASVDISSLGAGTHNATITLTGSGQVRTIAVSLVISANQATVLRINSGNWSASFTDSQGRMWLPDTYFVDGGGTYSAVFEGAVLEAVLSTGRDSYYFPQFRYRIPVANGNYQVNLHFIENTAAPGVRKFNVQQNGVPVLSNFDIRSEAALNTRLIKPLPVVAVTNGILELTFLPGTGTARVAGVEVMTAP